MGIAITLQQYLDGRGIDYEVLTHEPTSTSARTAEASHVSGDCFAKAVVLKREDGYLLAVIPASCKVELEEVADLIDGRVCMATEDEAEALFRDCEKGAFPPIGSAYGLDVVIDDSLDRATDIYFEAGDHRSLVHMSQPQFGNLTWDAFHGRIAKHV